MLRNRVQTALLGSRSQAHFLPHRAAREPVAHDESGLDDEGRPLNKGIHISLYLQDMRTAYRRADELGLTYVNHRFKRRAYSEEEAVKQCMFRMLDAVDPEDIDAGPILRLEHEVLSTTHADGRKYKSCQLDVVAAPCANQAPTDHMSIAAVAKAKSRV
mgnify:CR=1 FL=1